MAKAPLPLSEAQAIAEAVVGPVQWRGAEGSCACPGFARHTTTNAAIDCKVACQPVPLENGTLAPGIYCFHSSCAEEVSAANFKLRSELGKGRSSTAPRVFLPFIMPTRPTPSEFDPAKLAKLAAKLPGIDAAWLAARSPVRPDTQTPASFLHTLYKPGEKVIVFDKFKSQGQTLWTHKQPPFDACELDDFRIGRLHGVWFLANPVTGDYADNDRRKPSRRSWQTVTAWRYLVLESDLADPAHWLAALAQMPLPMEAIYTSGGKSIHALVRVDADSKVHWDEIAGEMKPTLITLGADPKTITAVRLTRLPGCERFEKGQMQTLLYLNATPDGTPICEKGVIQ